MNRLKLAAAMLGLMVLPVMAQDQITVPLPDVSGLSQDEAEKLIAALAQINVITSNCPGYEISDGEWTLLTGTGDKLAVRLGLDPATYERRYYGPAFDLLDDPEACDRIGPRARPVIDDLLRMGGETG
ncbi:MAG: hypothetical protein Q4G36_09020 [Paracoccus sp. (in: a-proteobacteria)]|nr:hypothetical protein [Paracoccus sp. (in: a-proteobacteria)]